MYQHLSRTNALLSGRARNSVIKIIIIFITGIKCRINITLKNLEERLKQEVPIY